MTMSVGMEMNVTDLSPWATTTDETWETQGNMDNINEMQFSLHILHLITILSLLLVTLLGNGSVLFALTRHLKKSNNVSNILIASMSSSDMLLALFSMPMSFGALVNGSWFYGENMCILNGILNNTLTLSSILMLSLIAIDRTCIMCGTPQRWLQHPATMLYCAAGWVLAFVVSIPWVTISTEQHDVWLDTDSR